MRCGAAIDDNIGKLLDYLESEDIADNTIVVYTADQGYFLGEHGFFDKRLIYEESLRMPFVIRYPKEIKGGQRIDDIVLNIDFAALIADYAGVEQPGYIQGESFRENLKGKTPKDWRKQMYYRYWLHHLIDRLILGYVMLGTNWHSSMDRIWKSKGHQKKLQNQNGNSLI